jgi:hypothetical protein
MEKRIKRLERFCKEHGYNVADDIDNDSDEDETEDDETYETNKRLSEEEKLNRLYEQMCWAFRLEYGDALKENRDVILTSEELVQRVYKITYDHYTPESIDKAFDLWHDGRLGMTCSTSTHIPNETERAEFVKRYGLKRVYHHPNRMFRWGCFSWSPSALKQSLDIPEGFYVDYETLYSYLEKKKAGYEPKPCVSLIARLSANVKPHDFIVYSEDKIKQYVIQDITYTRERAKKIIDEWQPKKDETRPKFILYSLILKDYAALDKLMGESLEPTYAEMWLAKRDTVEPDDWLESYRTWKDQMELEWINRQTDEN